MSEETDTLSDSLRRELALNRWAIAGTYAIGAFVIYLVLSQLAAFKRSLDDVTKQTETTLQETRTSLLSVSATMNAVAAKMERLDERVDTLRESRRDLADHSRMPPSQAHAREPER